MNSITINGIEYVRADLTVKPLDIGEKRIVAAEGGWVFVGDCTDEADGTVTIRNAKNIRRWGTTAGLGQLSKGPTQDTVLDDYGTVRTRPLITIAVVSGW